MDLTEQIQYSTVRIETTTIKKTIKTGTGYFFRFLDNGNEYIPAIITNKHVLEDGQKISIWLHLRDYSRNILKESLNVEIDNISNYCIPHIDPNVDLSIILITPIIDQLKLDGKLNNRSIYFAGLSRNLLPTDQDLNDFLAFEEIIMVGYPNGIWDKVNNMPIIRKGITATNINIDYNGKSEFLIDAACFPGSSGSPVFLYNTGSYRTKNNNYYAGTDRIKLLGTLYAGPQHKIKGKMIKLTDEEIPMVVIPNNLGFVIKSREILFFDSIFEKLKNQK